MAWCTPLIFGTFTPPAVSPMSTAPGIASCGIDCQPPAAMRARAGGEDLTALEQAAGRWDGS